MWCTAKYSRWQRIVSHLPFSWKLLLRYCYFPESLNRHVFPRICLCNIQVGSANTLKASVRYWFMSLDAHNAWEERREGWWNCYSWVPNYSLIVSLLISSHSPQCIKDRPMWILYWSILYTSIGMVSPVVSNTSIYIMINKSMAFLCDWHFNE